MSPFCDYQAISIKFCAFLCSQNPIGPPPSTGEAAEKGFALFEAQPSLQSPGSIEEHRASRLRRDKGHRGPFLWFISLGKQRNEQKKKAYSSDSC